MNTPGAQTYKRNQVEQAIVAIERVGGTPDKEILANVKRLLDADRRFRADHSGWSHAHLAFYDDVAPGNGAEIAYSAYHAFALLVGIRLLKGGLPQSRALMVLRWLRPELEPTFDAIATLDPWTFQRETSASLLAPLIANGMVIPEPSAMTFLVIQAKPGAEPAVMPEDFGGEYASGAICTLKKLVGRLTDLSHKGEAAVVLEIGNAVFQLLDLLPRMRVRKRGRQ